MSLSFGRHFYHNNRLAAAGIDRFQVLSDGYKPLTASFIVVIGVDQPFHTPWEARGARKAAKDSARPHAELQSGDRELRGRDFALSIWAQVLRKSGSMLNIRFSKSMSRGTTRNVQALLLMHSRSVV